MGRFQLYFEMLTQFLQQYYKTFFLRQRWFGKMRKIIYPQKIEHLLIGPGVLHLGRFQLYFEMLAAFL